MRPTRADCGNRVCLKRTSRSALLAAIVVLAASLALLPASRSVQGEGASSTGMGQVGAALPPDARDQVRFERLNVADGLSEGRVWGITQDRRGFMWFATWDGLNRYDGYEFRVFRQEPDNANSPGGTAFWVVYEDSTGAIWVGSQTGGGLSRYDPSTEQWTRYQHDPDDPQSLSDDNVYAILEDSRGVLWVGTEGGGLNRYEGEGGDGRGRFIRYKHDPVDPHGLGAAFVSSLYEDRAGVLWVGTYGGGLHRYDREADTLVRYQHDPDDPDSLSYDMVYPLYEDRTGALWVGTYGGGLNRYDRRTGTFVRYQHDPEDHRSLSGNTVTGICEDHDGTLWVGTFDGGLNRYHPDTDSFSAYQHDAADPRSIGSNTVASLYVDDAGTLWIGSGGSGISKLDPTAQGFRLYGHRAADANSLTDNDVRAVLEDRSGDLWIGTWGGLNRYDPETGRYTHYLHDPADPDSLSDDHVTCIEEDRTGVLWVGVDTHGLNRFDRETGTFSHFVHDPNDPHGLSDGVIMTLHEDRTGILWVGTYSGGLDALDLRRREGPLQFAHYRYDPDDPHSLGPGTVYAVGEDQAGELWVGLGGGGLCRFERDSETFACLKHDPQDGGGLSDNVVWAIHEDGEGVLWVGTSGGLNRRDPGGGEFLHYTTADGLPHNTVYGILEDEDGYLWLSTARGLSRFDPTEGSFANYGESDGLQGDGFNFGAYHRTSTGELFFGGPNGLTGFYPNDIQDNPHVPPVYVTGIQLGSEPVPVGGDSPLQRSVLDTEELALSHQDRIVSFEFAALGFSSPQKNRYRYKLEGFGDDWTEVGSDRRYATYTNLDPGEYTFRVQGSNNSGVWNEEGDVLKLSIAAPWWGTWWFRGTALLLVVSLVASGYVWRERARARRSRDLEREVVQRTAELGERVKELNCLYGISALVDTPGISLQAILQGTAELIPPAWRHPELTCARIVLEGETFATANWQDAPWAQARDVVVHGERAGGVEVRCLGDDPGGESGPFLQEEERLLTAIAERLGRIVERMRAEQALQHSQEQYALAQRAANIGTWDWDIVTDALYWSDEIEPMFGYGPGEFERTYPAFLQCVHPEDRQYVVDSVNACVEQGAGYAIEHRIVWPDGTVRWVSETGDVLRDPDGQATRMLGVVRDITQRKWMEEDLRASEQEYRNLVENISDVIYAVNTEGTMGYVSPAIESFLGYSVPEVLGRPFEAFIHPEDVARVQANHQRLADGETPGPNQYRALAKSGEVRWMQVSSQPIHRDGRFQGVQGVLTDITDRVRAREQAEQAAATAERERLARELHDSVTQTLYTVASMAEVLPEVWERYPEEGRRGLGSLRHLTRSALAEMRALLLELRPAALAQRRLGELVQQLAEAMEARTPTSIAVTVTGDRELPDEVQVALYRIAQEALNNVVKHAQADEATVGLSHEADRTVLWIQDDGRGFEPSAVESGGMGLENMNERARGIGAELVLRSQPGEGTEVRVIWAGGHHAV